MSNVAVIGGGITGLTAAFRLRQNGHSVTVFESADRAGGVIQTIRDGDYLAECGPNTLLETSPKIGELIADLGIGDRKCYSDPGAEKRFILKRGVPTQMPGSPPAFFLSKLFSFGTKLRLFREPFIKPAPEDAEESLSEFVLRRLGKQFLDYAINPFVAGVYAGDPDKLSVKHAFPKLHALEQKYGSLLKGQIKGAKERKRSGEVSKQNAKKLSFDGGLQVLTDSLAGHLSDSLRLRTPVLGLTPGDSSISVRIDGAELIPFDAVVLAMPAFKLAELEVTGSNPFDLSPLADVVYPPVASVVFGFRREDVSHPLDGFGTLNPEVEGVDTLGTIFSSTLFPDRVPDGHVMLTTYVGGTRSPDNALKSEEDLYALTLGDLRRIYGIEGEPTFRQQFVYKRAIPQYNVGYGKYKDLMAACEEKVPGIFFAGHCKDGISLSDSVVSGAKVAQRIDEFLGGTDAAGQDHQEKT